jgi:4a-hydroxytetrahydrobiopterin dehydratase
MAISELAKKDCIPCKGGVDPLKGAELHKYHEVLNNAWQLIDEHHLEKVYQFKDWTEAMAFANKVSDIAEAQDHHPDLTIGYGKVKVKIYSHKIDGLTESDFVFAAKVEEAHG